MRLRLSSTIAYAALGFRFYVPAGGDPASAHAAARLLGGLVAVAVGDEVELDFPSHAVRYDRLQTFVGTVNMRAIGAAGGSLLLHAGAVSSPDGGTAVFCGPSGAGKSTLTTIMTGRGYAYVTDETVCMGSKSLRITPFRKPVSIKQGSQGLLSTLRPMALSGQDDGAPWFVPPDDLGGPPLPHGPLFPQLIIFPEHSPGADLRVTSLGEAECAYSLAMNTSRIQDIRGGPLPALARLARRAPAYRVTYDHVQDAADVVDDVWNSVP